MRWGIFDESRIRLIEKKGTGELTSASRAPLFHLSLLQFLNWTSTVHCTIQVFVGQKRPFNTMSSYSLLGSLHLSPSIYCGHLWVYTNTSVTRVARKKCGSSTHPVSSVPTSCVSVGGGVYGINWREGLLETSVRHDLTSLPGGNILTATNFGKPQVCFSKTSISPSIVPLFFSRYQHSADSD